MIHNLSSINPYSTNFFMKWRSVEKQKTACGINMERMGEIMACEISKHLDYELSCRDTIRQAKCGRSTQPTAHRSCHHPQSRTAPAPGLPQILMMWKWLCFCLSVAIHKMALSISNLNTSLIPTLKAGYWSCWIQCWLPVSSIHKTLEYLEELWQSQTSTRGFGDCFQSEIETYPAFFSQRSNLDGCHWRRTYCQVLYCSGTGRCWDLCFGVKLQE